MTVGDQKVSFKINGISVYVATKSYAEEKIQKIQRCKAGKPEKIQKRINFLSEEIMKYENPVDMMKEKSNGYCCFEHLNAFWRREKYDVSLLELSYANPTKANHRGMATKYLEECQKEIRDLLDRGLIVPSKYFGHI